MVLIDEFYELSENEQQDFVADNRVLVEGKIADTIPDDENLVTILDAPLEEILINKLLKGRQTLDSLVKEAGGAAKLTVRHQLYNYLNAGREILLYKEHGMLRIVDTNGRQHIYTIETIPFTARIFDPLLVISLCDMKSAMSSFPKRGEPVSSGVKTSLDMEYAEAIGELWAIDAEKIVEEVTSYEREYVETRFGPFPLLRSEKQYQQIRDRLTNAPEYYQRSIPSTEKVTEELEKWPLFELIEVNDPIPIYRFQAFAIELFDMFEYSREGQPDLISVCDKYRDELLSIFKPKVPGTKDVLTGVDVNPEKPDTTQWERFSARQELDTLIDSNIEEIGASLDIPDQGVETAKQIRNQYRAARDDLIGTSAYGVAAACLYCSCKISGIPITPSELSDQLEDKYERKSLLRRAKDIKTELNLPAAKFIDAEQFVDEYCVELNLDDIVRERAKYIVKRSNKTGVSSGKSPSGWAAAAIYNACLDTGRERTQEVIAEVAGTSTVTIRNRYSEQRDMLRDDEQSYDSVFEALDDFLSLYQCADKIDERARELLDSAQSDGRLSDESPPEVWTVAALRLASDQHGEPIGWILLRQVTEQDRDKIRDKLETLEHISSDDKEHEDIDST